MTPLEKMEAMILRWNKAASKAGCCGSEFIDSPERVFECLANRSRMLEKMAHRKGELGIPLHATAPQPIPALSPAERNAILMADAVFGALSKPPRIVEAPAIAVDTEQPETPQQEVDRLSAELSDLHAAMTALLMEQPRNCDTCCWDGRGTDDCASCDNTNSSWTPKTVTLNPSDVASLADKLGEVL